MLPFFRSPSARSKRHQHRDFCAALVEHLEERCCLSADPVMAWNVIALEAVANDYTPSIVAQPDQGGPTATARALAIVHLAVYDATNSIIGGYEPYKLTRSALQANGALQSELHNLPRGLRDASLEAAVATAAYKTLHALYPHQASALESQYDSAMAGIPPGAAKNAGRILGQLAAETILAARQNDGADGPMDYEPTDLPGHHQADPLHPNQGYLGPNWGEVTPFTMRDGDQFRAAKPPKLSSREYADAFNQVKIVGAKDAETADRDGNGRPDRTAEQTEIGLFWAYDGASGLGTPPRLYNQIATTIAEQQGNTTIENARMLALINMAMADAGIASWETKYHYDLWRPVVAIRNDGTAPRPGGLDGNRRTTGEADWEPLGAPASNSDTPGADFTPPFPAYTSGHATFGGAFFKTLAEFYGTDRIPFDFVSDELNGITENSDGVVRPTVTRHFDRLSEAAIENAISRIYLGVHWQFDATAGLKQGSKVGNHVVKHYLKPVKNRPTPASLASSLNAQASLELPPKTNSSSTKLAAQTFSSNTVTLPMSTTSETVRAGNAKTSTGVPRNTTASIVAGETQADETSRTGSTEFQSLDSLFSSPELLALLS
jgi:hypothetical protein